MSKLGFKVFVDDPQPTALNYTITLQSVEVYAVKNGLKTQGTYAATNAQGIRWSDTAGLILEEYCKETIRRIF